MRSWLVAGLLALVACAPAFENPFDPAAGGRGLELVGVRQVGLRRLAVSWKPVAHAAVRKFAVRAVASEGEPVEVVVDAPATEATLVVDPGLEYAVTVEALDAAGKRSAPAPAQSITIAETPRIEGSFTQPDLDRLALEFAVPSDTPWITKVRVAVTGPGAEQAPVEIDAASGSYVFAVVPGETYAVTMSGLDASGEQSDTWASGPMPIANADLDSYLVALRRPVSPGTVTLLWKPVLTATRYRIFLDGEGLDPSTVDIGPGLREETIDGEQWVVFDLEGLAPTRAYELVVAARSEAGFVGGRSHPVWEEPPGWTRAQREATFDALPDLPPRGAFLDARGEFAYVAYADDAANRLLVYRAPVEPYSGVERVADVTLARPMMAGALTEFHGRPEWLTLWTRSPGAAGGTPHEAVALDGTNDVVPFPTSPADGEPAIDSRAWPAVRASTSGDAVYVHGGTAAGGALGDLWRLDFADGVLDEPLWTRMGADAEPRLAGHAVLRRADGSMFAIGREADGKLHVWKRTGSGFTRVALAAGSPQPPALEHFASAVLETRDSLVVAGGTLSQGAAPSQAIWEFDLGTSTWRQLNPTGEAPTGGPWSVLARGSDEVPELLVFARGAHARLVFARSPRWELIGAPPRPRESAAAAVDSDDVVWTFGGTTEDGASSELWSLELNHSVPWSAPRQTATPAPRFAAAMCADAGGEGAGSLLLYGGSTTPDDLALWRRSGGPSWTRISTSAPLPALARHEMVVSRPEGSPAQVVLVGGVSGGDDRTGRVVAVRLDDGSVRQLSPEPRPTAPAAPTCPRATVTCLDPRGRWGVSLVEGAGGSGRLGAWRLDLSTATPAWTDTQSEGPAGCALAAACADSELERAAYVLVSGATAEGLWRLDLEASPAAWKRLQLGGDAPALRRGATFVWQAARDSLLLTFGEDAQGTLRSDVWRLDLR